jgi:hypothetical protein
VQSYSSIYQQIYKGETKEIKNYESFMIIIGRLEHFFSVLTHGFQLHGKKGLAMTLYFLGYFSRASKTPFLEA